MLADAGCGHQVERARPEPVGGARQRPDRADLDRVSREVRLEGMAGRDGDLLRGAALEQFDERIAGDLLGEPGAAGARDTAFPVEQHLAGNRDRLRECALRVGESGLALPVGHRLVLQRALATLVAHRAIERVVDEQELHHSALSLLRHLRGQLRPHHHAFRAGRGARGERLALALHLDEALAAGAHGIEQRVIAEPRAPGCRAVQRRGSPACPWAPRSRSRRWSP